MRIEADAVLRAARRLDGNLTTAVEMILAHPGKLVVTGLGKSGHVARKIVSTLCSTGTPAVFLHAAEASHGDLGLYSPGDPTLMISKSGNTFELLQLVPFLRELPSQCIGILGNPSAPLASEMDVVLDASVEREADPGNLAPTASATVALCLGHALAVALMQARNFGVEDFGRSSRRTPGAQLAADGSRSDARPRRNRHGTFGRPAEAGGHRDDTLSARRRMHRRRIRRRHQSGWLPMAMCVARCRLTTIFAACARRR